MIDIILIEPEFKSNIGAVSRIIANFDFNKLIIIHPKTEIDDEVFIIAKHSKHILENAKIIKKYNLKELKKYDICVATTSKTTAKYNINRNAIDIRTFVNKIKKIKDSKIAIVFGREGDGLFNNEIELCNYSMTIPCSEKYKALNLSHAVGIVCYEIFNMKNKKKQYQTINKNEKNAMYRFFNDLTKELNYTPNKRVTTNKVFKRIIEKSVPSLKESSTIMGFLRKLNDRILK